MSEEIKSKLSRSNNKRLADIRISAREVLCIQKYTDVQTIP